MSTSMISPGLLQKRCGGWQNLRRRIIPAGCGETKASAVPRRRSLPIASGSISGSGMTFAERPTPLGSSCRKLVGLGVVLFSLTLLPIAAASAASLTPDLTWPPPPNPPRIRYIQSVTGPTDLGIRRSFFGRAFGFITGQSQRIVLGRPFGVALDDQGNLLVADTSANAVFWFDLVHHNFRRWDRIGQYRLASPVAVAVHKTTFYVADSGLSAVLAFDVKGELRYALTNGFERPAGLVIAGEKLFVADASAHCILVFALHGQPLARFGRRGSAPGEFNFPTHLAADANGHLIVTDSMNSRVQILDQAGHSIAVVGGAGDGSGYFSRPKGVAADSFGHIYVADALFDNIQVFDQEGRLLMQFGETGRQPGNFWLPGGIAISRENRIYVADAYNRRVQIFQYVGQP
ncbi:MAG: 6-bladed beta-propeller [Verrucomicrobiota bacterium]